MGGIGLILLLIILVGGLLIGAVMYVISGALWFGKTSPRGDRIEHSDRPERDPERPEHLAVDIDQPSQPIN